MQQAVIEGRVLDLDIFSQDESTLKLASGDAAMKKYSAGFVLILASADDQLIILDRDLQVVHAETGDSKGNTQSNFADLFDIIGRIAFARGLINTIENPFEMIESQHMWAIEQGHARHPSASSSIVERVLPGGDCAAGDRRRDRTGGIVSGTFVKRSDIGIATDHISVLGGAASSIAGDSP
jgi:hypothetical protein